MIIEALIAFGAYQLGKRIGKHEADTKPTGNSGFQSDYLPPSNPPPNHQPRKTTV